MPNQKALITEFTPMNESKITSQQKTCGQICEKKKEKVKVKESTISSKL